MTPERLGEIESAVCSEFRDLDAASEAAEELFSEVRRLKSVIASLREDAERYWCIRANYSCVMALHMDGTGVYRVSGTFPGRHMSLDAAIDAAIDAARKEGDQ